MPALSRQPVICSHAGSEILRFLNGCSHFMGLFMHPRQNLDVCQLRYRMHGIVDLPIPTGRSHIRQKPPKRPEEKEKKLIRMQVI